MKCFTHRAQDAIGVCRACQKGLCSECVVDHGYALSCRGDCEQEVGFARKQNIAARKLVLAQKHNRYLAPGFFAIAGLVFIATDAWEGSFSAFRSGLGVLFILFGVAIVVANRKWTRETSAEVGGD